MPHSIGDRPKDGDRTLLARLLDCHSRIREMLGVARNLAQDLSAEEDEIQAVAERLHRYFTRALPMHTKDEEESIGPRLMKPEARAALERMTREHREHEGLVRALVGICEKLANAPSRVTELSSELAGVVG